MSNLMKIRPVGAVLLYADRWTVVLLYADRWTVVHTYEPNSHFSNISNAPIKKELSFVVLNA
jgi:hypothetical protein